MMTQEIQTQTNTRGYFVSDLHLYSSRSLAELHVEAIENAVQENNFFVFGGDIFDFKWTTHQSVEKSIHYASKWLEDVLSLNPDCEVHFVMGNHDYHRIFMQDLRVLKKNYPHFEWHRWYLRKDNKIFMHGDVADGAKNNGDLKKSRAKHLNDDKQHPVSHFAYDVAVKAKIHKYLPMMARPKKLVAKRIVHYLENEHQSKDQGVTDIYFGHTHLGMDHYQHEGYTFHNGGAPLKGLDFRMVPIT